MGLDHSELPPFEPILRECLDFMHTTGINSLASKRLGVEDLKGNRSAHRQFIRSCHYGYDLAQRRIAHHVIDLEIQSRRMEAELKEIRRQKVFQEAASCTFLIRVVRERQLVLRRLLDSVLYIMVHSQEWILRHFSLSNEITRIDPEVLKHTVEVATDLNRDDRMRFSIVADLTTPVQIGDIVQIDRSKEPRTWKVIELKEGRMNEVLSSLIEDRGRTDLPRLYTDVESSLGSKAAKQVKRMIVQEKRRTDLRTLATMDRGTSPRFNLTARALGEAIVTADYGGILDQLCEEAKVNGYGTAIISDCLNLVSISSEFLARYAFGFVAHLLWHLGNASAECLLQDPARSAEEISAIEALEGIHDLVHVNLHSMWGVPMSMWSSRAAFLDLATRKVKVFARMDFDGFVRLAERYAIQISWLSGARMSGFDRYSRPIPGAPRDARGALAKLPSGREVTLMAGFFGRTYVNLTSPLGLIELLLNQPTTFRGHEINAAISD